MILRAVIVVVILAGGVCAPGQNGFIVHYNDVQASRSGAGVSVREVGDGYLLFCRQLSQQFPTQPHIYVRQLDSNGFVVGEIEYLLGDSRDFDIGYIDPVADNPDNTFIALVAEGWYYPSESWLYTFDQQGDTIGHRFVMTFPIVDSVTHAIRQTRRTSDGGAVLGGFWNRPGDTQAFLVRLNSELDTVWTKRIGLLTQDEIILGLAEYPDSGFLLTGYRQYGGPQNTSFLIRTDASGNPLWTRYYGGTAGQNGAVRVTSDGGIVTWSNYRESGWPPNYSQVMLTKWNASGTIIWQKKSHYGYYAGARDFEVLPDGSFIGVAFHAAAGLNGMLCKFSPQGDSLWTRGYQVASGPHYLNDVTLTSDGGFVCTGEANRNMPQDAANFQQSQTIYVLKTDSLGCVVPGCHTVGVQEYALDLNEYLRIAPNPVHDVLQAELELPAGTALQGTLRAVLLNAQGQQAEAWPMRGNGQLLSLREDVNALPRGMYFLHIADEKRWLAGGKVVVE